MNSNVCDNYMPIIVLIAEIYHYSKYVKCQNAAMFTAVVSFLLTAAGNHVGQLPLNFTQLIKGS